jgi:hypothetical protein
MYRTIPRVPAIVYSCVFCGGDHYTWEGAVTCEQIARAHAERNEKREQINKKLRKLIKK